MAFEKLHEYIDQMVELYNKNEDDPRKQDAIRECLVLYYETVMQHAKFSNQKRQCVKAIFQIAPYFSLGYFGNKLSMYIDSESLEKVKQDKKKYQKPSHWFS